MATFLPVFLVSVVTVIHKSDWLSSQSVCSLWSCCLFPKAAPLCNTTRQQGMLSQHQKIARPLWYSSAGCFAVLGMHMASPAAQSFGCKLMKFQPWPITVGKCLHCLKAKPVQSLCTCPLLKKSSFLTYITCGWQCTEEGFSSVWKKNSRDSWVRLLSASCFISS